MFELLFKTSKSRNKGEKINETMRYYLSLYKIMGEKHGLKKNKKCSNLHNLSEVYMYLYV